VEYAFYSGILTSITLNIYIVIQEINDQQQMELERQIWNQIVDSLFLKEIAENNATVYYELFILYCIYLELSSTSEQRRVLIDCPP
jgi:hypothetical protein